MKYSIFIPFLSKSKTIQQCLNAIHENSVHKHEIVLTCGETDVYFAFNEGVYKCKNDVVVMMNDDMIVSKGWDRLIPEYAAPHRIITGYVVQKRAVDLLYGPNGLIHDCGDENNFDYNKFQTYVDAQDKPDYIPNASGWYMPLIVNKKSFVTFPNVGKFPFVANDFLLFDMISKMNDDYEFGVINSYFYHFQHATSRF